MARMRIALVSPYSWTYPGGVTRHIEALAEQFLRTGHDVDVLAPFDPDDRLSVRMHAGARPEPRAVPDYLIPLGRTVGLPVQRGGLQHRLTANPVLRARRRARAGRLRRRPRARADRADPLLGRHAPHAGAARGHLPLLLREPDHQRDGEVHGRQAGHEPPQRAHRRLRGRGLDRPALLRRHLPRDSQRRRPRGCRRAVRLGGAAASARRPVADRVRGPGGRAQGPARAAARLRGAARARPGHARGRRRRRRRRSRRCCSTATRA